MNIIVLNSGSNGNAVYVESTVSGTALLLDCGISRKRIEQRLKIHGKYLQNIRAVFVSHEHRDHVMGLPTLTRVSGIPVYATELTGNELSLRYPVRQMRKFAYGEIVRVDDLEIRAFPKSHDAVDAVFFIVRRGSKSFLYATDLGIPNSDLTEQLSHVNALLLESNYDESMLMNGSYPEDIKARIDSPKGHLSNRQAMDLVERYCDGTLRALIFGHISENNNTHEIVRNAYESIQTGKEGFEPRLYLASRHDVSELISI